MSIDNQSLVTEIAQRLVKKGWYLTTAESCTGGGLAQALTEVPGSSQWFERGFITYSNAAKREMLGVTLEILNQQGAVSEQVACAMALGARVHSHAQCSIAITGIAGPDGGTLEKPVGTICYAWALPEIIQSYCCCFKGNRQQIRWQTIQYALQTFWLILKKFEGKITNEKY